MNETSRWIVEYLRGRGGDSLESKSEEDILATDYFEAGLVDSFGVVELIGEVEKRFGITLEQPQLRDRRFSTIGGMADIIEESRSSR
mgnify:CR=1 FL=1